MKDHPFLKKLGISIKNADYQNVGFMQLSTLWSKF